MESMMGSPRSDRSGDCKEHLRLEVDNPFQSEEFARVVIAIFMSKLNPTLEEVDDMKTAVSETVTNAIVHGYQGRGGVIHMKIMVDAQENVPEVCVEGARVGIADVERTMEPMFTTDPEGERFGTGFSFIEAFMDQVDTQSEPGKGTLVSMKKFIGR